MSTHFRNEDEMLWKFHSSAEIPALDVEQTHDANIRAMMPGPRNEKGYRADSFDERGDVNLAFIGCSWVEGLGVARDQLFSDIAARLYSEETGVKRVNSWNLGLTSSGIDYVLRMMPAICTTLKPDFLLFVLTGYDRREYFLPTGRRHQWVWRQPRRIAQGDLKVPAADVPFIDSLGVLRGGGMDKSHQTRCNDVAHVLRTFRAIQGQLEAAHIPWLFSSTDFCGAADPTSILLELGALPADHYTGFLFGGQDQVAEHDPHPGPASHSRFATRLVDRISTMKLETRKRAQ